MPDEAARCDPKSPMGTGVTDHMVPAQEASHQEVQRTESRDRCKCRQGGIDWGMRRHHHGLMVCFLFQRLTTSGPAMSALIGQHTTLFVGCTMLHHCGSPFVVLLRGFPSVPQISRAGTSGPDSFEAVARRSSHHHSGWAALETHGNPSGDVLISHSKLQVFSTCFPLGHKEKTGTTKTSWYHRLPSTLMKNS